MVGLGTSFTPRSKQTLCIILITFVLAKNFTVIIHMSKVESYHKERGLIISLKYLQYPNLE